MPGEPRGMWCSNQTCEARIQARKWAIHQQRLREMRPSIDAKDPRRPKKHDGRKARLEEERNQQIMHENTILLNKLSRILTREPTPIPPPLLKHGLNENNKKADRDRIDRENQALLRRLQEATLDLWGLRESLLALLNGPLPVLPFDLYVAIGLGVRDAINPADFERLTRLTLCHCVCPRLLAVVLRMDLVGHPPEEASQLICMAVHVFFHALLSAVLSELCRQSTAGVAVGKRLGAKRLSTFER